MWHYDPMAVWTVQSALAQLPHRLFGIETFAAHPAAAEAQVDDYGRLLRTAYVQAYLSYNYNSYTVPFLWSYVLWGALGLLLLVGIIKHHVTPRLFVRTPKAFQPTRDFLVKHLYLSALVGSAAARPVSYIGARGELGRWTSIQIPRRIHGLIVLVFVVTTVGLGFFGYEMVIPTVYFPAVGYAFPSYLRYFSDRTGFQAIVLTPLVFILSGRNSPVTWMTGVDYSTLQLYHRWVARMAVYTSVAHGIGYCFVEVLADGTYFNDAFDEAYWNWGWAAMVGGAFLVLSSMRRLRELSYEIFLFAHIVGALVWLIGCYYHIYLLDPKYMFLKYLYATIFFWAFDRAIRSVMAGYYSFGKATKGQRLQFAAEGTVTQCGSYVLLRVRTTRALPLRFSGPGSYVFIRSLNGPLLESHPFTIAFPSGMPRPESALETPGSDAVKKDFFTPVGVTGALESQPSDEEEVKNEFELIVKPYSGWTRTLVQAQNSEKANRPLKLLVEGPYGNSTALDHYDSALLVAGGSGISAMIAHLADVAKSSSRAEVKLQRMVLVWAVRDPYNVEILVSYLQRFRGLFPSTSFLKVHIYYTGDAIVEASTPSTSSEEKSSDASFGIRQITSTLEPISSIASFSVHSGRPSIVVHLDDLLPEGGKIAVVACGPEGLCDQARLGVKSRLDKTISDDLVYHEESFTW